ncbi:MAG: cation:proton antiporter, partial [Tepidisphaeraceae bacterium]
FCTLYFVVVMSPRAMWTSGDLWRQSLLEGLFAAPTSAGVLFSMLAAAGLSATWLFQKARVLAIFDDLHTILLLIPLKMLLIGLHWQLAAIALIIVGLLWVAWHHLNSLKAPVTWPWILGYSVGIMLLSELVYWGSKRVDPAMPIHLEVLLPAFALGCILKPLHKQDSIHTASEERVGTIISACFMVLVGLSMPPIRGSAPGAEAGTFSFAGISPETLAEKNAFPGWGVIALHVVAVTLLSNLGKMFPALCYRREVSLRQRLALAVGMFPRGEVGAGVLVIALSYGISGATLTVAVLSLTLNLVCTGFFIVIVRKLISEPLPRGA